MNKKKRKMTSMHHDESSLADSERSFDTAEYSIRNQATVRTATALPRIVQFIVIAIHQVNHRRWMKVRAQLKQLYRLISNRHW